MNNTDTVSPEVMLSVYVPTFNHEKYIVQALESIRMQKTQYSFEVLVGEDVSTDNTRTILKQYEVEHPGFLKVFYREQNMHALPINNAKDLKNRCRGKYLISLEGDDYWTDPEKIEKQISFLESHPDYIAVAHRCMVVDENSSPRDETYPECRHAEYTFEDYVCGILPGQLATVMYRNYIRDEHFNRWFVDQPIQPGDRKLFFSLLVHGRIHCMNEVMSCYRHVTSSGSSYSANYKPDIRKKLNWCEKQIEYANMVRNRNAIKWAEASYMEEILGALKRRSISPVAATRYLAHIKHKSSSMRRFMEIRLMRANINRK